ncbi:MAG: VTT domain-containing protein [Acidobacteria bacterium]|nr:VTT domain-containing protein [Acidobacteriota bacterium]
MDAQTLIQQLGPYAATLVVGFLSALIPVINIELFLLAAAAIASKDYPVWTLGVVAGVGQMSGKIILYWSGAAALNSRMGKKFSHSRVEELRHRMSAMNPWVLAGFNFMSASVGFPPFLLVSILAGVIEMKFWHFLVTGLSGRVVRMVVIVAFPHAIKGLFR